MGLWTMEMTFIFKAIRCKTLKERSEAERQQLAITLARDFDMENSVNSDKLSTSFLFLKFGISDFCYINC